jgi:predicted DNA-binding antitoxin AbrB/MazE fold protein
MPAKVHEPEIFQSGCHRTSHCGVDSMIAVEVHASPGYALNMTLHANAIYEGGVLRPLTPLELAEHQVVSLSISVGSDQAATESSDVLVRDRSAFLNSYAPEDEGLYDDYSAG